MTVGDMIVRDRRGRLAMRNCTARERDEILKRFTPRSISTERWPPTKAEVASYDRKAGR